MSIHFSSDADYLYYADSINDVGFELESTCDLDDIADEIRMRNGYPPLFKDTEDIYDNGWYLFKLNVDIENQKVNALYCVVKADKDCPDAEEEYNILAYTTIDDLWQQFVKLLNEAGYSLDELKEEILNEV